MKGLLIKDNVSWQESWSAEIGKSLTVKDSTYDLLIFDEPCQTRDIMAVVAEAPSHSFEIVDLEETTRENCEYLADSGRCYRRKP